MKALLVLLAVALVGCARENVRVSCEGRLQPINAHAVWSDTHSARGTPTAPGKPPAAQGTP
jgi:hypothetical protein